MSIKFDKAKAALREHLTKNSDKVREHLIEMKKQTKIIQEKRKAPGNSLNLIYGLRDDTGHSLMDCRDALKSTDWDIQLAKEYLNSSAWKAGKLINKKG